MEGVIRLLVLPKLEELHEHPVPTVLAPPVFSFAFLQIKPPIVGQKICEFLDDKPPGHRRLQLSEAANTAKVFVGCQVCQALKHPAKFLILILGTHWA